MTKKPFFSVPSSRSKQFVFSPPVVSISKKPAQAGFLFYLEAMAVCRQFLIVTKNSNLIVKITLNIDARSISITKVSYEDK